MEVAADRDAIDALNLLMDTAGAWRLPPQKPQATRGFPTRDNDAQTVALAGIAQRGRRSGVAPTNRPGTAFGEIFPENLRTTAVETVLSLLTDEVVGQSPRWLPSLLFRGRAGVLS